MPGPRRPDRPISADRSAPADHPERALDLFHPIVRRWFAERVGTPTEVQRRAWPEIASGRHVLVTAPTGTGKTLTAFLWALDRLLTGATPGGTVRVLYVSPLKALNADVHRNLEVPLAELAERFAAAGEEAPDAYQRIRAAVRSGDTPQSERQKMVRRPPEILITTPESLNLLLTSEGGRSMLGGLETVILDEIHAVAGTKRGTHLITAVERLTLLSGELQRVALSATVRPLDTIAGFVGGYEVEGEGDPQGDGWRYTRRPVSTVVSEAEKVYDLEVCFPGNGDPGAPDPLEQPETSVWDLVVPELKRIIHGNRSTLVFANSRRLTEKLTRMVNADEEADLAYSHHGSLSREVRQVVEARLKRGELPAIVSTSSLELGIDIGALDRVVMVESPRSVASAIQRVGRAGHRVGEVSRGTLLPIYGRDFLDAAVVTRAVLDREIEDTRPVRAPLDVLAQVILSMVVAEVWDVEELFAFLRSAWPYRELKRRHFDLVLEMLAGRYADSRVRELSPRISLDKVTGTVRARPGAARLLYLSGGTIPDRGYYHLRVDGGPAGSSTSGGARIGELDEEFVWERSVGDTFTLGTQIWRIRKITHNDVFVEPASGSAAMAPFWRADARDRDFFVSERVGLFLEAVEPRLDETGREGGGQEIAKALAVEHSMSPGAAAELVRFLRAQKASLGGLLPHRHRIVAEHVTGGDEAEARKPEAAGRRRVVLHTFWGGRVNRPLAVALATAWEERFGAALEILHDDDCLMVTVPEELAAEVGGAELLAMVPPERVEELLRERLERTGFFGALFRQNASRALLLPRAGFRHRMPLWVSRERAKRMLQAVGRYGDFPLVLETWRSCLEDELDLETLKRLLGEVRSGDVEITSVRTEAPSPFAANLVWKQTNLLMYASDRPEGGPGGGALRKDLLRELVFASHLRPRIPAAVVEELRAKLQRLAPGYAPRDGRELLDWLKERVVIPAGEWAELAEACERDLKDRAAGDDGRRGGSADLADLSDLADLVGEIADRAVFVRLDLPGRDRAAAGGAGGGGGGGGDGGGGGEDGEDGGANGEGGAVEPVAVALETLPRLAGALGCELGALDLRSLDDPEVPAPASVRDNLERLLARPGWGTEPAAEPDPGSEPDLSQGPEPLERLADLVGEWLRFEGPVPRARVAAAFGGRDLDAVLEMLVEDERIVVDELSVIAGGAGGAGSAGITEPEICDAGNLETLLRWTRAAARPAFQALPLERLPLFLATHQGLAPRGRDVEALQSRLEALFGFSARARSWEADILPARLDPYRAGWLDGLMHDTELTWRGTGPGRITFLFPGDLELVTDEEGAAGGEATSRQEEMGQGDQTDQDEQNEQNDQEGAPAAGHGGAAGAGGVDRATRADRADRVGGLFPDRRGRFALEDLADHAGLVPAEVSEGLWRLAWQGRVTTDSFAPVRRGIVAKFRPPAATGAPRAAVRSVGRRPGRLRRRGVDRWSPERAAPGLWSVLPDPRRHPGPDPDPLEREELAKDRARLLLDRYGILFRELLAHELPVFQWSRLFRSLRLMELSGEVLAGQFFTGVPGLQFASPSAFQVLRDGLLPDDAVYWMNARDPASLAGVDLPELKAALPARREGSFVAFHGDRIVVTARRRGRVLDIRVAPDHPRIDDYLELLKVQLGRDFAPRKAIEVEEINGEPASESPYVPVLRRLFSATVEPRSVKLRRRY